MPGPIIDNTSSDLGGRFQGDNFVYGQGVAVGKYGTFYAGTQNSGSPGGGGTGAIWRSCAAFAASALITTARHSPQASSVMTKAASGAAEHVAFIKVTNLARAIDELKAVGFAIIGLDSGAATLLDQIALPGPHAIVLGAEDKGLRRLTIDHCDVLARLALPGPLKSLNVSNAAALALYAISSWQ